MDINEMTVIMVRTIFGLMFIFFIPGFAMTWALYVRKEEIPVITRCALSFIMSMATIILATLFLDYVIGVDTTPFNIMMTLIVIIIIMLLIWGIRYNYLSRIKKYQMDPQELFE